MRFYTVEKLGPKRARTPEGYLLCEDVPLARTGVMIYGPKDGLPIKPKPGDERIVVHRRPEDVFAAIALASIAGKPFVTDHPEDDVIPATWSKLAKGIVLNPRRGTDAQDDLVLGDIMVTDPDSIEDILNNEDIEISLGYDADYEQIGPGEGVQKNLIINHIARVKDGRCGPRCSIGDTNTVKERKVSKFGAFLLRASKAKDAAELAEIGQELEGAAGGGESGANGEHHVHVHLPGGGNTASLKPGDNKDEGNTNVQNGNGGGTPPAAAAGGDGGGTPFEKAMLAMMQQIAAKLGVGAAPGGNTGVGNGGGGEGTDDAKRVRDEEEERKRKEAEDRARAKDDETIEGALEMEAPPGTEDKARKSKDSSYLADSFQTLVSQIEVITPGARIPTFDSKDRPAVTYSKICGMRTETLDHAYQRRPELAAIIDRANGGRKPDFTKMTCDAARVMISTVAAEAGRLNNKGGGSAEGFGAFAARQGTLGGGGVRGKIATPADLNKLARELYKA